MLKDKLPVFCHSFHLTVFTVGALLFSPSPLALSDTPGDLAPRGNPDTTIDIADYVILQRIVLGEIIPTPDEMLSGDVAPFGGPPDGILNAGDLVVLMRAITGEITLPNTQPSPPILNLVTVSYISGGQITVSGSAGAVTGNFQVSISTDAGYSGSVPATSNGSFSATFASNGATSMSLQVIDGNGASSITVSRGIGNANEESLNAEVLAVWNGLSTQLTNGNAQSASDLFSLLTKDKYLDLFNALGSSITNLPGYWSSAIPIILEQDYAEYAVKQTVNGQERLHLIGFVRDSNGQWLIEQL